MQNYNYKNHLIALSVFTGLFSAAISQAAYTVEIPLPGMPASISDPGEYVRYLFIFGLSLAGFLAVGAVAIGGVQYMLAGASIGNTQKAKDLITGALMGVGLLLGSYLLLTTIDPTLTNLSPRVPPIGNVAAPPKERVGVDYGMAVTDTTETFIYTTNQIGSTYGSLKGCGGALSQSESDLCVAKNACEQLGSELSAQKKQKLIRVKLERGQCSVTFET